MARLEKVYAESNKPDANLQSIKKFLRKVKNEKRRLATLRTDCAGLTIFSTYCDKPFTELVDEDIYCFFDYLEDYTFKQKGKQNKYTDSSIYNHKAVLRKFLKFIDRPDLASLIVCRNPSKGKLPDELLTKSEVELMINSALTPRDSALLATIYESGARKGELSSVQLKHITFDENGCVIILPTGKTGPRRIRLVYSASYLNMWVNQHHPTKHDRESYLFVSLREPYPKLSESGLYHQLQRIADRVGITKKVNPHSFRHARATELAKDLSDQQLKSYLGWTAGSTMAAVYVHLSGKDLDKAILKLNGINVNEEKSTALQVGRCPRCKEINPESSRYCGKCGMPLKDESIRQLETESDSFETEFAKLIAKYPKIIEELHANKNDK